MTSCITIVLPVIYLSNVFHTKYFELSYSVDVASIVSHYNDVIMSAMASKITSLDTVYSTVYSGTDKKKSKLCVTGSCEGNSPVTGEFPEQTDSNPENASI